jgi:hypothetical protein
VSSNIGTSRITTPNGFDFTTTIAIGAGESNRSASYSRITDLSDFHHEFGRIFRVRQPGRANLRGGSRRAGISFRLDAQMDARAFGYRERLKRAESAMAEDGIDMNHKMILANRRPVVEIALASAAIQHGEANAIRASLIERADFLACSCRKLIANRSPAPLIPCSRRRRIGTPRMFSQTSPVRATRPPGAIFDNPP